MRSCPYCQANTQQVEAGKLEGGVQEYRCLHCNRLYVLEPEPHVDKHQVPENALPVQIPVTSAPVMQANPIEEFPPTRVPQNAQAATPAGPTFLLQARQSLRSGLREWAGAANSWGLLPEIAVIQSAGLVLLAWAFVAKRAVAGSSPLFLWISLAVLILPAAIRLASVQPARRERIGLVLLLGLSLYLVKVMYSPMAFTFPDELSHLRNVNEILATHHLFQENPVLPVTAYYPGLAIITSTLASLSGLSSFSAGILVIGIARLILFLALFLLYEQVSGSARIASLALLIYVANPNFLYWISEYAYEPLALPLVTFVLLAVVRREMAAADRRHHLAWTVVALLGLLTVVITHHMSSYILTLLLVALVVFYAIRSRGKHWGPWDLALVALLVTSSWLIFVANLTISYLSPVFLGAARALLRMIMQEEQSRALFTGATGSIAPAWEQFVAILSTILIAFGLPFGAYETWKNHRKNMFALLLAAIALVYLPMQILRFTRAGWETANRSSEFLFIGIGFVLALALDKFWLPKWSGLRSQTALAALAVVLFFGGLIAGWPPRARWPRPFVVSAGNHLIQPQVVSVAEWMLANLGPDNRVAASKADAKMLNAYEQYPFTDNAAAINKMFLSQTVGSPEKHALLKRDIEYVMSDRKVVSWDHMIGYFFYNQQDASSAESQMLALPVFDKFDGLKGANRLLDAGDIVIYDVSGYLFPNGKIPPTAVTPSAGGTHP